MKKYISCPVTDLDSDYADYVINADIMSSKLFHLISLLDQDDQDKENIDWIAKITFKLISYGQDEYKFDKTWLEKIASIYEEIVKRNNIKEIYYPSGSTVATLAHILRGEANVLVKMVKSLKTSNRDDLEQWYSILSLYLFNVAVDKNKHNEKA